MSTTRNPQQQRREPHTEQAADSTAEPAPDTPTVDTVIIYTDGSYHQEGDLSGTGFVLKSNGGDIIAEQWNDAPAATTSMETEGAAALQALREAKRFQPSHIVLYSDCKPLVDRLDNMEEPENIDTVFRKARLELSTVEFASVNHIPRERNRRADELAHRALRERQAE